MGNENSKELGPVCTFCATELHPKQKKAPPKKTTQLTNNHPTINHSTSNIENEDILRCHRCHGLNEKHSKKKSFFSTLINNSSDDEDHQSLPLIHQPNKYLIHVFIAPFSDTLRNAEEKDSSEESLINHYIRPYFTEYKDQQLQTGHRLLIKNIEFKIFGCYPPTGIVNEHTLFHMQDEYDKLLNFIWHPIRRIHFLPISCSLKTYNRKKGISIKKNDENEALFITHIKPFLKETDHPLFVQNTNDYIFVNDSNINNVQESFFSTKTQTAQISNKSQMRHLMIDDTFVYRDIQFRVMECVPRDGFIDSSTEVYINGSPVEDIVNIRLRPIYEDLPNRHKDLSSEELCNVYVFPYFRSRSRYIDNTRELNIFGVRFIVRQSVPNAGIVTCETVFETMIPLQAMELQRMQEEEDMQMARRMQEEENTRPMFYTHNMSLNDIFQRLHQTHGMMNNNTQVYGQQPQQNSSSAAAANSQAFVQLLQQFQQSQSHEQEVQRGIEQRLIDRLPTFHYTEQSEDAEEDNRDVTCRICLEMFVNGEELRLLPCFHKYHKDCVDHWLKMSTKCPICKSSIAQQLQ